MKEVLLKLIELLKTIIERYPANWAIKVIMAISVFIILPILKMAPYLRDYFSFLLTLLVFCGLILLDLKAEGDKAKKIMPLILKLKGKPRGETTE
uniref:Uncharacterized protein n=1 Tax=Candidatus Methanophagaceae archaeon ANME-1 ERB6 TaxID=2759912 RepID=A0A7G9YW00_9EURY|nr:hypothetical protein LFOEMHHC_00010 [Methanosarcinales archaeon ANME-1 ERB6]